MSRTVSGTSCDSDITGHIDTSRPLIETGYQNEATNCT